VNSYNAYRYLKKPLMRRSH